MLSARTLQSPPPLLRQVSCKDYNDRPTEIPADETTIPCRPHAGPGPGAGRHCRRVNLPLFHPPGVHPPRYCFAAAVARASRRHRRARGDAAPLRLCFLLPFRQLDSVMRTVSFDRRKQRRGTPASLPEDSSGSVKCRDCRPGPRCTYPPGAPNSLACSCATSVSLHRRLCRAAVVQPADSAVRPVPELRHTWMRDAPAARKKPPQCIQHRGVALPSESSSFQWNGAPGHAEARLVSRSSARAVAQSRQSNGAFFSVA